MDTGHVSGCGSEYGSSSGEYAANRGDTGGGSIRFLGRGYLIGSIPETTRLIATCATSVGTICLLGFPRLASGNLAGSIISNTGPKTSTQDPRGGGQE